MIDIDLKYHTVVFGSYEDIGPNPDTLKYFIEKFSSKELIPTTFQEIRPNGVVNRFSLTTSDEVWLIEFSSDRIDIHKVNKNVGVVEMGTLEQFLFDVKEIVKTIDEKFPKKHNRLSLVTRYLLRAMDNEQMSTIYHKLNNTIDVYNENNITDWSNRIVARIPFNVGEKSEVFNVISQIKRLKGTLKINSIFENIDRVEFQFDLNTYQGNSDYRFDLELINSFLDTASNFESELKAKYLKLIEL